MKTSTFYFIFGCALGFFAAAETVITSNGDYAIIEIGAADKPTTTSNSGTNMMRSSNRNSDLNGDDDRFFSEIVNGAVDVVSSSIKGVTGIVSSSINGITGAIAGGIKGIVSSIASSSLVGDILGTLTPRLLPNFVDKYLGTPQTAQRGLILNTFYNISSIIKNADPTNVRNRLVGFTDQLASTDPTELVKNIQAYSKTLTQLDPVFLQSFIKMYAPTIGKISPETLKSISESLYGTINSTVVNSAAKNIQSTINQNVTTPFNATGFLQTSLNFLGRLSGQDDASLVNTTKDISSQLEGITSSDVKNILGSVSGLAQSLKPSTVGQITRTVNNVTNSISAKTVADGLNSTTNALNSYKPNSIVALVTTTANLIINTSLSTIRSIFGLVGNIISVFTPGFLTSILSVGSPKTVSTTDYQRVLNSVKVVSSSVVKADDNTLADTLYKISNLLVAVGQPS